MDFRIFDGLEGQRFPVPKQSFSAPWAGLETEFCVLNGTSMTDKDRICNARLPSLDSVALKALRHGQRPFYQPYP